MWIYIIILRFGRDTKTITSNCNINRRYTVHIINLIDRNRLGSVNSYYNGIIIFSISRVMFTNSHTDQTESDFYHALKFQNLLLLMLDM